jgi:hypothetical protein
MPVVRIVSLGCRHVEGLGRPLKTRQRDPQSLHRVRPPVVSVVPRRYGRPMTFTPQCPGTMSEPCQGEIACSRGLGCLVDMAGRSRVGERHRLPLTEGGLGGPVLQENLTGKTQEIARR